MSKRKCGSCRFFQEAGLAGSGWCHHPLRRTSSDTMIMVRRNELACRNGWSEDLWAASSEDGSDRGAITVERHASRPVVPASVDEIAAVALVTVEANPPLAIPEDVVVGQTPVMRAVDRANDSDDEEADERSALLGQDTRSAIKRARERHRAKIAPRTRSVEIAASSDAERLERDGASDAAAASVEAPRPTEIVGSPAGERTQARQEAPTEPEAATRDVNPRPDMTLPFNLARVATPVAVEDPFDSVPVQRPDVELPRARHAPRRPLVPAEDDLGEWSRRDSSVGIRAVDSPPIPSRPVPVWAAVSWSGRLRDDADYLPGRAATETDPVPEPRPSSYDLALDRARQARVAATAIAPPRGGEDQIEAPAAMTDVVKTDDRVPVSQDDQMLTNSIAGLDEVDDDELDMTVQIAPDVPRACRTCRDFRPAEGGGRGWCTNKFAFSHRRMVTGEGVPCQTSLGCWWLPHDDVWLVKADVAAHSHPTPLFDAWQAEEVAREAPVLPPVRRRRRS